MLLVMSDNGPQMSSGTTREFIALCRLATHYGRPGTPTDQAWIESLFGHLKIEQPHLELIEDIDVLRAELETLCHTGVPPPDRMLTCTTGHHGRSVASLITAFARRQIRLRAGGGIVLSSALGNGC